MPKKTSTFSMLLDKVAYLAIWVLLWPVYFMPLSWVHSLGKLLGSIAYIFSKNHRKLAMNNLSLAKDLNFNEKKKKKIVKASFQSLFITSLEYIRLRRFKNNFQKFVSSPNQENLNQFYDKNQGAIVVTGHYSNWEIPFIAYSQNHPSVYSVGRPIKNKPLYNWIQGSRTMHGGVIFDTKNAIKKAIKVLKEGAVFSIVNDQALPESSYSYPLFGIRAWTSPTPALLSYKTKAPILVVTPHRRARGKYEYIFSKPFYPNLKNSLKQEAIRLMDLIMKEFEDRIRKEPNEWLWFHKRWKQEGYDKILKKYKYDSYLFIMPNDSTLFHQINDHLKIFRRMCSKSFFTVLVPEKIQAEINLDDIEKITYSNDTDVLIRDYKHQMVFDFAQKVNTKKFYLKLGAFKVLTLEDLKKLVPREIISKTKVNYSDLFVKALCHNTAKFD